jgi:hypothetical protein
MLVGDEHLAKSIAMIGALVWLLGQPWNALIQ